MKTSTLVTVCTAAGALTASALAQAPQQQQRPGERDRAGQQQPTQIQRPMMDQQMRQQFGQMQMLHHIDDIHGARVTNYQRENLGSIKTLIIDAQNEQVVYAVISIGGFLGIGDSLIAVPWDAFELRPLYDGLVLNMTRSQLEAAPQFDGGNWPNFGDQQWQQRTHQHYGTTPRQQRQPGMQEQPGRSQQPGMEQQPQRQQQPDRPGQPGVERPGMQAGFLRTNELIGTTVEDQRGESVGDLNDIAMELYEGKIAFAVVGTGGFLGMWQEDVAVPWQALQITEVDRDDYRITTSLTQERLERAPEYDRDGWPTYRHLEWAQQWYPTRQPARPGVGERDWDREPRQRDRERPEHGAQQIQQQLQQGFTRAGMEMQEAQRHAQQLAQQIQRDTPSQQELQQMLENAMTQAGVEAQRAQQEAQRLAAEIQRLFERPRN